MTSFFDLAKLSKKRNEKLAAERLKAFIEAEAALEKEYGCQVVAVLRPTKDALLAVPTVECLPQEEYERIKSESKPTDTPAEPANKSPEAKDETEEPPPPAES